MDTTETSAALWAHVARKRLYSLLQWCQWRVSDRWTYQLNEHLHHFIVDDVLRVVHQQVTIGCVQHLTTYQRQTPKTWHQWRVHSKKLLFNLLFSFHKFSSGTASPGWSRKGQYNGCGVCGYYSVSVVASVLWYCWLDVRNSIQPVKLSTVTIWLGATHVIIKLSEVRL